MWVPCSAYLLNRVLNRAALLGRPSHPTSGNALLLIHKLRAMSLIVYFIALISVRSGPNFVAYSKMLLVARHRSCAGFDSSLRSPGG